MAAVLAQEITNAGSGDPPLNSRFTRVNALASAVKTAVSLTAKRARGVATARLMPNSSRRLTK
jgi:hypothetical protein